MKIEHSRPKLLREIPDHIHNRMLRKLEQARLLHPFYRDDELLLWLWWGDIKPQEFKRVSGQPI